jgi:hypothetical protein
MRISMKSSIWRLAGVGLLCLVAGAPVWAEGPQDPGGRPQNQGPGGGFQGQGQSRPSFQDRQGDRGQPPRQDSRQPPRQQNQTEWQQRVDQFRGVQQPAQGDRGQGGRDQDRGNPPADRGHDGQRWQGSRNQDGQRWQGGQGQAPVRPQGQGYSTDRSETPQLPIQGRPDSVRQTQEPIRGTWNDRRNDGNHQWQAGSGRDPRDERHPGRGNGWGPGPQYRPGQMIDRFAGRYDRVPWRGQDYYYSGGYWYRPQGQRYEVITPPHGLRTRSLPDYAQQMWIGSSVFFLAAGTYYQYVDNTRDYVVVNPPVQQVIQSAPAQQIIQNAPVPQPASSGYDVTAYPANGQSPQQIQQDRYDCYRWAVLQSGFDPATVSYAPAPEVVDLYRQNQGNCLASRGYTVE